MTCQYCNKKGHLKKQCRKRKKDTENNKGKKDVANLSDGYENGEGLILSEHAFGEEWILDSGCTFHMTPRNDQLFNFKNIEGDKVLIDNNQSCHVIPRNLFRL